MAFYWLMYLVPASLPSLLRSMRVGSRALAVWILVGAVYVVVVGFRNNIGCDWVPYLIHYDTISKSSFAIAVQQTDFAYAALNWVAGQLGLGIFGVNAVSGTIAMTGIIKFSRKQPLPWLAMTVAVPYLIIVILMGYSRQGVAIGLIMWGLAALQERRIGVYIITTLLAALFHKTAVVMLPLALVYSNFSLTTRLIILIPVTVAAFRLLLADSYDSLMENYVTAQMRSEGGFARASISAVAGILFFATIKRWRNMWGDGAIWICLSIAAIASVALVSISSTAVDRLGLFLIPLQLAVCARLPVLFKNVYIRSIVVSIIVVAYGMLLYTWLTHSQYARECWVPYKNLLVD